MDFDDPPTAVPATSDAPIAGPCRDRHVGASRKPAPVLEIAVP
jgi:hypothetical protein